MSLNGYPFCSTQVLNSWLKTDE